MCPWRISPASSIRSFVVDAYRDEFGLEFKKEAVNPLPLFLLIQCFFALIERQAVRNRVYSLYFFLKSEKQKIDINSLKSLQIELRSEMMITKDKAILQCRVPLSEEKREKKIVLALG